MAKRYLILLFVIYCLVRLPIILSPWAVLNDEHYTLCGQFLRGAIAMEAIHGFRLPLWDYLDTPYAGGTFIAGLRTAPFFKLFGPTLFALKMAPFCWQFLALIPWYFVFKKSFSPRQTFLMLLFLVCPPPQITQYMLSNIGFHFDMILWVPLSILIFRVFLDGKLKATSAGLLLGLLNGFASFQIPTNLITVIAIWIYLAFHKGEKKNFYWSNTLGFLIGFSPWIYYNWNIREIGWSGVKTLFYYFDPGNGFFTHIGKSLVGLFFKSGVGFQGLLGFRAHLGRGGIFFDLVYVALYIIGFILLWRRNLFFWGGPKNKFNIEIFGIIFQIFLVTLVVLASEGVSTNYYLFPLVPFVGMMFGNVSKKHWVQNSLAGFLISTSLLGNFFHFSFQDFGKTLKMPGYYYGTLAGVVENKFGNNFTLFQNKFQKLIEGRPNYTKKLFYEGLIGDCFFIKDIGDLGNMVSFIQSADEGSQTILYEKLGKQVGWYTHFQAEELRSLIEKFESSATLYPAIYKGFVQGLDGELVSFEEKITRGEAICKTATPAAKPSCYEGLGLLEGMDFITLGFERYDWILSYLEKEAIPSYFRGKGKSLFMEFFWNHSPKIRSFLEFLKSPYKEWLLEGFSQGISEEVDPFIQDEMRQQLAAITP